MRSHKIEEQSYYLCIGRIAEQLCMNIDKILLLQDHLSHVDSNITLQYLHFNLILCHLCRLQLKERECHDQAGDTNTEDQCIHATVLSLFNLTHCLIYINFKHQMIELTDFKCLPPAKIMKVRDANTRDPFSIGTK